MHIYVLRIAESGADMEKAKISCEVAQEQNRNGFLDYCEEEPLEDDTRNMLLESYNHKLFIPGKDDKSFRLVKGFKAVLGDIKLQGIKALLEEMTPENFHIKQWLLEQAISNKWSLYVNEQKTYSTIPLDEWIMSLAREDVEYTIVQQFDAHI